MVSATLDVLNAGLLCLLRRMQTENADVNRKITEMVTLFRIGTQSFNSGRSLGYAHCNKFTIFSYFKQANRNIHPCQEKKPFTSYPAAKQAPKTQQTCNYRHTRKTSGLFQ